jgi:fibronectin type 3 domain-containing protein
MKMRKTLTSSLVLLSGCGCLSCTSHAAPKDAMWKFDFGSGAVASGYTRVTADMHYTPERRFGFENAKDVIAFARDGTDALHADGITSKKPFLFSVAVPEGNYKVSLTLGHAATATPLQSELRRAG